MYRNPQRDDLMIIYVCTSWKVLTRIGMSAPENTSNLVVPGFQNITVQIKTKKTMFA